MYRLSSIKIISGGQTGVDRAALDAARALGLDYGGAVPQGRLTEDGRLDDRYAHMTELSTNSYPARTEVNVVDADATLIVNRGVLEGGTALTIEYARKHTKPYLHIDINRTSENEVVRIVKEWLEKTKPSVLNVAGPRESKAQGIYDSVYGILRKILLLA